MKGIHEEFGSLDVLLNIAGYAEPKSLLDTTSDNLVTTFTINVFAMLLLTRELVRYMQGQSAKVLNIASTAGITSRPGWVAYAASKAAVVSLSQTLADELAGTGIKVYSISPGRDGHGAAATWRPTRTPPRSCSRAPSPRSSPPSCATKSGRWTARTSSSASRPDARVGRIEYLLASAVLRVVGLVARRLPLPARPRRPGHRPDAVSRGQSAAPPRGHPARPPGPAERDPAPGAVLVRVHRQAPLSRSARAGHGPAPDVRRWFIVDNAYLPIHLLPHRRGTTVIQVWHAVGALKRFGWDTSQPLGDPERRFLHRYYDWVVCSAERSRRPYAAAFRSVLERVLPLGTPRVDAFADPAAVAVARERILERYPALAGKRVVLVAPTFRGRGVAKRAGTGLDAVALRAALPDDHLLVLKTHPNLDPAATANAGFDLVIDRQVDLNEVLVAADVVVTDYSSSIFEWALLRRPLVLFVPDLEAYEADPGMYLDYRTGMIGSLVVDTAGVADAVQHAASTRPPGRPSSRPISGPSTGTPATASWSVSWPPKVEVLPFRAMSATSEAPAAYRNTAGDPGAIALVREAIADVRSRRRLVRYLVQADMHKRGADTLLGNFWWILDPLLQMAVYVVLVTLLARGHGIEHYPLFIFAAILPWKWFTSSVTDATSSVASQDRLIKQIRVPQDRPARGGHHGRCRGLRVGPDPVGGDHPAVARLPLADPRVPARHRRRPVHLHAGPGPARVGRQRLLPGPGQRRPARPAAVVLPVARAVQPDRPRGRQPARPVPDPAHVSWSSTRSPSCSRPTGRSSGEHRMVGHRRRRTGHRCSGWPSSARSSWPSPRSSSSASSRASPRSCDDDRRRPTPEPTVPDRPSAPPPRYRRTGEPAITAEDLGVSYDLRFTRKTTIRRSFGQMFGRGDQFWALRHVSVQLLHGESLAVIGPNGAGKSTFLQVLAGIIGPSEGSVDVRGHVSGLLTLGAGFDKELSGVDNILLGGAFLGLDDAVTRRLMPSIIEYAELGEFIDAPLKTYSSGMRARLGFAIATSIDPDILLLDEVLATGDASFRAKSKARVIEIVQAARAGEASSARPIATRCFPPERL